MEAVAELNRQGIPTGILIAPLMPGINDSPEQVERILELAEEAGAVSVGGIALHLRGEVRGIFFDWLRSQRPDLVPRYERLYARGAYAPRAERERIAQADPRPRAAVPAPAPPPTRRHRRRLHNLRSPPCSDVGSPGAAGAHRPAGVHRPRGARRRRADPGRHRGRPGHRRQAPHPPARAAAGARGHLPPGRGRGHAGRARHLAVDAHGGPVGRLQAAGGGRARPEVPQGGAADHQDGPRPQGPLPGDAHGGQVPQARPGVLVPVRDPQRLQPRRPVPDLARGRLARAGEDRLLLLPGLAGRLLRRRTGPSPPRTPTWWSASATTSTSATSTTGPRKDTLGANRDGEVQTLAEYRAKYRQYKADPNLRAMHAQHSYVGIWDDHEVEDNYAGSNPGEETQQVRVPFLNRKASALPRVLRVHAVRAAVRAARGGQRPVPAHAPGRQRGAVPARRAPGPRRPALRRRVLHPLRRRREPSRAGSWATARRTGSSAGCGPRAPPGS